MTKLAKIRFGPLSIIAVILVVSAGLRLFGVSSAYASNKMADTDIRPEKAQSLSDQDSEMDAVLRSFQEREAKITAEENRIDARLRELASLETTIAEKIAEMEGAETKLRSVLAIAETAAEDDVAQLTAVYETMKPKDAANVFEQMQPAFAAGFLSRMRADAAASILAALTPQSAYAISVVLAGRHVDLQNVSKTR